MKHGLNLLAATVFVFAATAGRGEAASRPDPIQILDAAYSGPASPYQGRVILTQWVGKQTRAEEVNVYFAPPNRYRLEFLAPDGSIDRIVVGDGQQEQIQLIKQGKIFGGYTSHASTKFIDKDEERRLLLANYRISLVGNENVMGRSAWVLDFAPSVAGKPTQRMWVDRETNAVLEVRRSLPTGGATSRFTRFEPKVLLSDGLFGQDSSIRPSDVVRAAENPEDVRKMMGVSEDHGALEGGFALLGADLFDVEGEKVRHLRYTDGLIPVSLFVTRAPVEAPKAAKSASQPASSSLYFGLSTPVNVSQWKEGKDHFTIVGEVDPALLKKMSAATR